MRLVANGLSEEAKDTMGVFDFVQKNVSQMMIARPDHLKHLIVYKHPDQNFPMYSQLTVDSDECAVFFKDGRVVGVLPPGRHTMHTQNIPFLGSIVNQFTGGNVFISEIFFVKTVPVRSIPFGGPAGEIVDPGTGLQVPIRIFGEFSVVVTDPVRFIVGYSGQAAAGDNDQILQWVKGKFINSVGTVLCELAEAEQKSILSVINNKERLAQAFVTRAPALNDIGIRITEMGKIDPNIPEEHMVELRAAVKELADAQREVRKKQIAIAGAAADAQANQFSLEPRRPLREPARGRELRRVRRRPGHDRRGAGDGGARHGRWSRRRRRGHGGRRRYGQHDGGPVQPGHDGGASAAARVDQRRRCARDLRRLPVQTGGRQVLLELRHGAAASAQELHGLRHPPRGGREVLRELRHEGGLSASALGRKRSFVGPRARSRSTS